MLKLLPKDHRLVANIYILIGNLHRYEKHFSRTMKSYNIALTICKEITKEDQLVIATCYANLGSLYLVKQDFDKGLEYYQKALTIRERCIPIPHSTIGNLHIKLTQIDLDRGQAELAFLHYRKALEICSKCLPRDHFLLSKAYYIAAMTHKNFDTGTKAIEFFDRACVARYRDSFLTYTWIPLDKNLYKCPQCQKVVWIYNVFGVFSGWSCFTCMKKLVSRHPVNPKMKPVITEDDLRYTEQRTLEKSHAFFEVSDEPLESLFDFDNESDEDEHQ